MRTVNILDILALVGITAWLVAHNPVFEYNNTVNAQTLSGKSDGVIKEMKTYTNEQYKFTISYPTNWEKIEFTPGITESGRQILVTFLSPLENPSDSFREYLTIEVANFSPTTTFDRTKVIQYAKSQIDGYKKSLQGFQLKARTDQTTDSIMEMGNPACYKVLYNYTDATAGRINVFDIYCAKDSKIYFLSFKFDSAKSSLYLPLLKQIINSFKLP